MAVVRPLLDPIAMIWPALLMPNAIEIKKPDAPVSVSKRFAGRSSRWRGVSFLNQLKRYLQIGRNL
jgi:hypothetical protein